MIKRGLDLVATNFKTSRYEAVIYTSRFEWLYVGQGYGVKLKKKDIEITSLCVRVYVRSHVCSFSKLAEIMD